MQVPSDESETLKNTGRASESPTAAPTNPDRTIGLARLHIIPVDAHRLFAHWYVPSELLASALRESGSEGESQLALRVFDVVTSESGERMTKPREDFPAGSGWHDGFISLETPGGSVAATLGVKNARGELSPILTSLAVTLPEAPHVPAFKPGEAKSENFPVRTPPPRAAIFPTKQPEPSALPVHPLRKPAIQRPVDIDVLDEPRIIAAVAGPLDLPPELRRVPRSKSEQAEASEEHPDAAKALGHAISATPALDERLVVAKVLTSSAEEAGEGDVSETGAPATAKPSTASDATESGNPSQRLASNFDSESGVVPIRLRAQLIINGTLQPDHRLRIGNQEVTVRPGGSFTYRKPLHSFPLAWSFLLHVVSGEGEADHPSVELLSRMPDVSAPLSLRSTIEIEGQVTDPEYLGLLPAGVNVDSSGWFRIVRPLPAGAWFLPELALFAEKNALS